MYNSFFVGLLVKLWNVFLQGYDESLTKKIVTFIKRIFSFLFNGSLVKKFFIEDKDIIEESRFYKAYSWILGKYSGWWNNLNRYIETIKKESISYENVHKLFKDQVAIIKTIFVFTLSFALGIPISNMIKGAYNGRSYTISFLLIILSLIGIALIHNIRDVLETSIFYNFIKDLFAIDEGVDQWW